MKNEIKVNPEELAFQKLNREGLEILVDWAKKEGWNPGPYDSEVFWQTDPGGYYGYFLDEEMIGGGSLVSYDGNFGFMGFFIIKPEFRGSGIGRQLWYQRRDLLLSRLKPGAPIGMDGVVDMQPFYNKGGFEIAFRDERYERKGEHFKPNANISPIDRTDFTAILEYDTACVGYARPAFLKPWLNIPESKSFKYVEHSEIKGFAVLRKAGEGYKIGPLFANNAGIAEALYQSCLNSVPDENVYLDIPVINKDAVALVKKHEAEYVFECARMYYGGKSNQAVQKIFGITTFELG